MNLSVFVVYTSNQPISWLTTDNGMNELMKKREKSFLCKEQWSRNNSDHIHLPWFQLQLIIHLSAQLCSSLFEPHSTTLSRFGMEVFVLVHCFDVSARQLVLNCMNKMIMRMCQKLQEKNVDYFHLARKSFLNCGTWCKWHSVSPMMIV